jgi:hypothetical protein
MTVGSGHHRRMLDEPNHVKSAAIVGDILEELAPADARLAEASA